MLVYTGTHSYAQALSTLKAVLEMIQPRGAQMVQSLPSVASSGRHAVRVASEVVPLLPELLPGIQVCTLGVAERAVLCTVCP